MDELAIGATFADHVIRGVAGRGGMGIVYRALHVPLKREVALKVIASEVAQNEEFRARFRRELEAAASIQHPNVIPIYHAGEEDGLLFVTMRFVDGVDLARLVVTETRLAPTRAALIIGQVAAALDAAHARGLVHRDVKPANVMLDRSGPAALTDFGLARGEAFTVLTKPGQVMGTLDYLAPELIRGEPASPLTDLYALGCLAYECTAGKAPFADKSLFEVGLAHLEEQPVDPCLDRPELPAAFGAALLAALEKDPAQRPDSAGAFATKLRTALEGGSE